MAFKPTHEQQISLSMAYLAYSGEELIRKSQAESVAQQIYDIMQETMPKIPPLCDADGHLDWQIVWGPAIYTFPLAILQDNLMFVAQQISQPKNYVVGIRGTNGMAIWDWIREDFEVWRKVNWTIPEGKSFSRRRRPKISRATDIGIEALLHHTTPIVGLPGEETDITTFLTKLAQSGPFNVTFTGHSLAGALAPTLALWFKQSQGLKDHWDPATNATIATIAFAGATAGNDGFRRYYNKELGSASQRIYNTLDMVPHAWETADLKELPDLYESAGIKLPLVLRGLLDFVTLTVRGYKQIKQSMPFTWVIDPSKDSYLAQAGFQHVNAYPTVLEVPILITAINRGKL